MSLASIWATQMATQATTDATVAAQVPAPCVLVGFRADVVSDGGCHLSNEAKLSAADALTLGNWLVSKYQ